MDTTITPVLVLPGMQAVPSNVMVIFLGLLIVSITISASQINPCTPPGLPEKPVVVSKMPLISFATPSDSVEKRESSSLCLVTSSVLSVVSDFDSF
ncbi:MAG: hypothetical protein BWZ05_01500 [Bacteroidetes bacterium ADurb.BinA245]|nr:MAG: hypothetical protein BWZ05_01500 [Bacteroidetes bacterium ADurb.BinA245]